MKAPRIVAVAFFIAAAVTTMGFTTRASESDKLPILSFGAPVELPGISLPAGTYIFEVLDFRSERNIAQVFDKDQSHLHATFLTIPDYRLKPLDKPIVRFLETAAGGPPARSELGKRMEPKPQ